MSGAPKLITLEAWVAETYGEALTLDTARRWCREGRIRPMAEKHGRTYFVTPDARYTEISKPKLSLVERLRAETENSDAPRAA